MMRPATFAGLFVAANAALLSISAAVAAPLAGPLSLGEADAAAVVQVNGTQKQGRAHQKHRVTHRSSADRNRGAGDNTAYEASGYNYGANVGSWGFGGRPNSYGYGYSWPNAYGAYGYAAPSYGYAAPYGSYGYGSPYDGTYGYGSYGYGNPGSAYGSAYGNYGRGCVHGTPSETSAYPSWMVCESR